MIKINETDYIHKVSISHWEQTQWLLVHLESNLDINKLSS